MGWLLVPDRDSAFFFHPLMAFAPNRRFLSAPSIPAEIRPFFAAFAAWYVAVWAYWILGRFPCRMGLPIAQVLGGVVVRSVQRVSAAAWRHC